jgi:hypothetical protein
MKTQIESSQAIVTALLCTMLGLALFTQSGCKATDYCIANNPKAFYKEVNAKPFHSVNQQKCFKFKN